MATCFLSARLPVCLFGCQAGWLLLRLSWQLSGEQQVAGDATDGSFGHVNDEMANSYGDARLQIHTNRHL